MNLPKIAIPDAVKERFSELIKTQGLIAALQFLCPIELHFSILANMKFKGEKHDIAILYSLDGAANLGQDPKDVEAFLYQLLAERGSKVQVTVEKVKYDNRLCFAVFVDRP